MGHFSLSLHSHVFRRLKFYFGALLLAIFYWSLEALTHFLFFEGDSFFKELYPGDYNELWMRLFTLSLILGFYAVAAYFYLQQSTFKKRLKLSFELFDALNSGILLSDQDNKIIYVNRKYTEITGYLKDEVLGKDPAIIGSGKQNKAFYQSLWQSLKEQGHWEGEMWNRKKSGELFAEWINISVIDDPTKKAHYYLAIFADVSGRKLVEEKMTHYAYYDSLTNLPNRRLFFEQFQQVIQIIKRKPQKLALLFIDLDKFKSINDQYGHQVGDECLKALASALQKDLRESDLLARLGGDEFVILLTNLAKSKDVNQYIRKLNEKIAAIAIPISSTTITLQASIGSVIYPDEEPNLENLVQHADKKMYEIKAQKKECSKISKRAKRPHSS